MLEPGKRARRAAGCRRTGGGPAPAPRPVTAMEGADRSHSPRFVRLGLAALIALLPSAVAAGRAPVPALPDGARTTWVVERPEEIINWRAFDPATVRDRLPAALRFITVSELAAGEVRWARDFLAADPQRAEWGVSFLEIVRMGTCTIDGRAPVWPREGAVALWVARVAPADSTRDLGPGQPWLTLDFWLPDSAYAAWMREKGYHATPGDVRLGSRAHGRWSGSVTVNGLRVMADCAPVGPVSGGAASSGAQAFFPPATSPVQDVVRVAFAGHRERGCDSTSTWRVFGTHPLAGSVALGGSSFEFGYTLRGASYPR